MQQKRTPTRWRSISLRKRERERAEQNALERLRGRILSGIHGGHLNPGDRLPSYRDLTRETGLDLRAAARIYDALESEGLVEARGKAGFYVASQERIGGRVLAETARWTVGVLTEAWQRQIPLPEYPELVRRCIASIVVRCACIESTEDQLASLCGELHDEFGLATTPVHADSLAGLSLEHIKNQPSKALRSADVVVTTVFHSATVRPTAAALKKPLIVMRLDPDLTDVIERHLDERELTVVCVDPRFLDRIRAVFGGDHPDRIHGVLASNRSSITRLPQDESVLVTRAARASLTNVQLPPSLLPAHVRRFAAESAREVIETIIRLNLEAMRQQKRK